MWFFKHTDRIANRRGFSLLELLLVVSLISIFVGAMQESVVVGLRAVNAADERELIRQQAASALDRIIREINLADDVDVAQSARFRFDIPSTNNINYVYSSGTLSRDTGGSAQVVLNNITSWDFNYYDTTGAALSEPVAGASEDTIRVVQMTVTVTRDAETLTLTNAAYLRNM